MDIKSSAETASSVQGWPARVHRPCKCSVRRWEGAAACGDRADFLEPSTGRDALPPPPTPRPARPPTPIIPALPVSQAPATDAPSLPSPLPSPTTTSVFAPRPQAPAPPLASFRPTGAKRSFSQSLSPPSASSSDDDEAADPPLKRRYLSPPQPFAIPPNTQPGMPVYQPYYTSHSSGVGVKRGADDLGVDDDDDDGSSTEGEGAASSSSNATHDGFAPPSSRPPPVKRMRRGLSSHLKRMGLNPADVGPTIEEHPTSSPFAPAPPAWNPYAHPEVQPSSIVEPGEVGPAVWLGHSRSGLGDEVRFEELSDSDSGELEDERTRAWRLELWKGNDTGSASLVPFSLLVFLPCEEERLTTTLLATPCQTLNHRLEDATAPRCACRAT